MSASSDLKVDVTWPLQNQLLVVFLEWFNVDTRPATVIEGLSHRVMVRVIRTNVHIKALSDRAERTPQHDVLSVLCI
jgi:hypothetical protein